MFVVKMGNSATGATFSNRAETIHSRVFLGCLRHPYIYILYDLRPESLWRLYSPSYLVDGDHRQWMMHFCPCLVSFRPHCLLDLVTSVADRMVPPGNVIINLQTQDKILLSVCEATISCQTRHHHYPLNDIVVTISYYKGQVMDSQTRH